AHRVLTGTDERFALIHQIMVGGVDPIPFEHCKFRVMGRAALAVAEDMGELPDARHPGDEQFLHREFGRGVQVALRPFVGARVVKQGCEGPQMRFEPGAHLQGRRVDLDITACRKEGADRTEDPPALVEPGAPCRKAVGPPPFLHRPALALAAPPTYVSFYRALSPRPSP